MKKFLFLCLLAACAKQAQPAPVDAPVAEAPDTVAVQAPADVSAAAVPDAVSPVDAISPSTDVTAQ